MVHRILDITSGLFEQATSRRVTSSENEMLEFVFVERFAQFKIEIEPFQVLCVSKELPRTTVSFDSVLRCLLGVVFDRHVVPPPSGCLPRC